MAAWFSMGETSIVNTVVKLWKCEIQGEGGGGVVIDQCNNADFSRGH